MSSDICTYYAAKSVFITGATGFLGKVLIEKLLRSCAEVKYIYVLIRSKRGQNAKTRLRALLGLKLFETLKNSNPKIFDKLVAIEGDIAVPNLGISENDLNLLIEEVSVVFHSAATVSFDEPLRSAINFNVLGTRRVIQLCHQLPKLSALIYVSTAYSNCNRHEIEEIVYRSTVAPQKIIDLCELISDEKLVTITPQIIGDYPNTYTFTKALAETLVEEEGQGLPVAIFRPSIVAASWLEPMPGWVDNLNGLTGNMVAIGKGVLRHGYGDLKVRMDVIPVDIVINFMITLVWLTATKRPKNIRVYNCTSGALNPITCSKINEMNALYSIKYPSLQLFRYPSFTGTNSNLIYLFLILLNHLIPAYLFDGIINLRGGKTFMVNAYRKLHQAWRSVEFFLLKDFQFTNNKQIMIWDELSQSDKLSFKFDIRQLDWNTYWDTYWSGIRLFILKEDQNTLCKARNNLKMIYYRDQIISIILLFVPISLFFWKYFVSG